jgi:hypothetical protein
MGRERSEGESRSLRGGVLNGEEGVKRSEGEIKNSDFP